MQLSLNSNHDHIRYISAYPLPWQILKDKSDHPYLYEDYKRLYDEIISTKLKAKDNGILIAFEGQEGSGKSFCAKLLTSQLASQGHHATYQTLVPPREAPFFYAMCRIVISKDTLEDRRLVYQTLSLELLNHDEEYTIINNPKMVDWVCAILVSKFSDYVNNLMTVLYKQPNRIIVVDRFIQSLFTHDLLKATESIFQESLTQHYQKQFELILKALQRFKVLQVITYAEPETMLARTQQIRYKHPEARKQNTLALQEQDDVLQYIYRTLMVKPSTLLHITTYCTEGNEDKTPEQVFQELSALLNYSIPKKKFFF